MDDEAKKFVEQTLQRTAAKRARAAQLAAEYPDAICLVKEQPHVTGRPWYGCAVHRSARNTGKWQVSFFDSDGFAYDFSEPTYEAAIYEALKECTTVDMTRLDRAIQEPDFMAGVIWSMLPDDKKWTTRLADVREEERARRCR